MNQIETARHCLRLIRDIADRSTTSSDLANGGYTLQELRQVGVESVGAKDRLFEPVPMGAPLSNQDLAEAAELCRGRQG